MNEAELPQRQTDAAGRLRRKGFLLRQLRYMAVLVLAIAGVAYTNISDEYVENTRSTAWVRGEGSSGTHCCRSSAPYSNMLSIPQVRRGIT